MTTLSITVSGKSYSYEASPEQIAGLGAIVASINAKRCLNSWAGLPAPAPEVAAEMSPEAKTAALLAYAASKRYAVETGGTTVAGVSMPTDRDTQAKIAAAYLLAQVNPATSFDWKTSAGFVTLSAAQIGAIAVSVGQFVQSAYAAEASVASQISNGTITTTAQIDGASWPA